MEDQVKFAVYDSFGNYLGHKADSSWNLAKEKYAKLHSKEKISKSSNLVKNLLFLLNTKDSFYREYLNNMKASFNQKRSLYIVAEEFESGEGIAGITLSIKNKGKYKLAS